MQDRMSLSLMLGILLAAGSVDGADLILTGGKIYPSPTDPAIENGSVLIHDGRIVSVGPASTIRAPRGAAVIDCKGLTVTASFWNSHVHIFTPALLRAQESSAQEVNEQLDAMFNRWGFTTVFDLASILDKTVALRRRIESGELHGPRVLTVGEPVWSVEPVYVRDYLKANQITIANTETPEQAVSLVRAHAENGAQGIKLFTGSYQGGPNVSVLPLAIAKAAVEEAHNHRIPVFAHPQNLAGVDVAIEGGVDILAHTVPQSPPWTPEFVARLKKANIALIPTLTLFDSEGRKAGFKDAGREAWLARMVAELHTYSQAGGEILFGTDIGYIEHYDTAMEFSLMSQAGMTFEQILASLTTTPAKRFGSSNRSGRIAPGMDADLVVLSGDPAKEIAALSKVRHTIRNGKVIYTGK
jgi:imidazolonepropionase-like amidohydrolase